MKKKKMAIRMIPLTQGKVALVSALDYEWLSEYKWYATKSSCNWYARRHPGIYMHREIMNCPKGKEVHHEDTNSLNNDRFNLSVCTRKQHAQKYNPYFRKDGTE